MRVPALVLAVLLAASCSSSTKKPNPPGLLPSPTASAHDAYSDLTPPTSPGIGDFPDLLANRAYVAAQGYLAAELLEPSSLSGVGGKQLATLIQGVAGDPAPARDLTGTTAGGLRFRPLLARGVTLPSGFATVVRSVYTGDEVRGRNGEKAIRIQWSGAVHYDVRYLGRPYSFSYSLKIAYVFSADPVDRAGLTLQVTVPRTFHVAPAQTACLAKGIVLPVAGTITAVDDSEGPWPQATAGAACPV